MSSGWCGAGHPAAGSCPVRVAVDDAVLAGTGPARLLDMVEGRSKASFKAWLAQHPKARCDGVEVVTMDGFTGSTTAASEEPPTATAVMDPFHVVRLARGALDQCRRRVQQELHGLDNYRLRMLLIAGGLHPNDEEPIKPSKSQCKPSCGMLFLSCFFARSRIRALFAGGL